MGVVRDVLTIPCHRKFRFIANNRESGESKSHGRTQWFQQECLAIFFEGYPRMAVAIATCRAHYKSGRVIHVDKLTPSPQGKIFTVPFFQFLKLVRRLPVVFFTKLFLSETYLHFDRKLRRSAKS